MATVITSGTISADWLQFAPDSILDGQALANAGDTTSDEFMVGYDQGGVAVYVEADTTVDIDSTETLDAYLVTYASEADASAGTVAEQIPFFSVTGSATYEIGGKIAEYIPSEVGPWARVKLTTSGDESLDKVNVYLRRVSS